MTTEETDTKVVINKLGYEMVVPATTIVGDRQVVVCWGSKLGEYCDLGRNSRVEGKLGDRVTLGTLSTVGTDTVVGNDVEIGDETTIGDGCVIGDDVVIGNKCIIEARVHVQPGVIIPNNWRVPSGIILNPGPGGTPVPITPQASLRCNVQGTIRAAGGIY